MVKLANGDFPELSRCFLCLKFWPMEKLKEVVVHDFLFRKQVCKECLDRIESGGVDAKENTEERKPDSSKVGDSY